MRGGPPIGHVLGRWGWLFPKKIAVFLRKSDEADLEDLAARASTAGREGTKKNFRENLKPACCQRRSCVLIMRAIQLVGVHVPVSGPNRTYHELIPFVDSPTKGKPGQAACDGVRSRCCRASGLGAVGGFGLNPASLHRRSRLSPRPDERRPASPAAHRQLGYVFRVFSSWLHFKEGRNDAGQDQHRTHDAPQQHRGAR